MSFASSMAAATLACGALLASGTAEAYCRTSACEDDRVGSRCVPAQFNDCGKPLFWASRCVGYSIQENASPRAGLDLATATRMVAEAFDQWRAANCGVATADLQFEDLGPVSCDEQRYNQKGGNQNAIIFRDDSWPYAGGRNTLALTTVTYNLDTGEIYDADMEINSYSVDLTFGSDQIGFDLQSILTHEAGHFLGLSHSTDPEATMYEDYKHGSTFLRSLNTDDVEAICAAYPPGTNAKAACDFTPRHGFLSDCASDAPSTSAGCCSVARGAPTKGARDALLAAVAGAAMLSARLRARLRRSRR